MLYLVDCAVMHNLAQVIFILNCGEVLRAEEQRMNLKLIKSAEAILKSIGKRRTVKEIQLKVSHPEVIWKGRGKIKKGKGRKRSGLLPLEYLVIPLIQFIV